MSGLKIRDLCGPPANELLARSKTAPPGKYAGILPQEASMQDIPLHEYDIALVGVNEYRASGKQAPQNAADLIRHALYPLAMAHQGVPKVIDLGNLHLGNSLNDTYHGLGLLLQHLEQASVLPIILGGTPDLLQGFGHGGKNINLLTVDARPGWDTQNNFSSENYLNLLFQENKINDYINLAGQQYYSSAAQTKNIQENGGLLMRLARLKTDISTAEPHIRQASHIGINLNALQTPQAPGKPLITPNGLSGQEICQLTKYAGYHEGLQALGLFNYYPEKDKEGITAVLLAQMIWYFIDGFVHRQYDVPDAQGKHATKFIVTFEHYAHQIIFYKSDFSGRWWLQVPGIKQSHLVACSQRDYHAATRGEVPDIWSHYYQKFNST